MKCYAFSSSFAKIVIYIFSFVLAASATHIHEGFLHCLTSHISNSTSTPNPIIYTPKNPSYFTILNSSIQNPRFSSPSTPKPFLIVTPFHVSDVQATVYCSKKHGMEIRTRSGGHDLEGLSYVSNTGSNYVVIDLRNLSSRAKLHGFKLELHLVNFTITLPREVEFLDSLLAIATLWASVDSLVEEATAF